MTTDTKIKQQIYQIIESLPAEQLPRLLNFVNAHLKPAPPPKNQCCPHIQNTRAYG